MNYSLPPLPDLFEYRLELSKHVTPRLLKEQPIHRWFYFPHSFSPQLVEMLFEEWNLKPGSLVVDPFVGAGTTLRVAQTKEINGLGADLSPLSVFVSNVKIQSYNCQDVQQALSDVKIEVAQEREVDLARSKRLAHAFTDQEYAVLKRISLAIAEQPGSVTSLLLLALLRIQQQFSRAVPDGGWFRWVQRSSSEDKIWPAFEQFVDLMLEDLDDTEQWDGHWHAHCHDARNLQNLRDRCPPLRQGCQAIVTSPPYPNRHDYSRIFQIELLTLGLKDIDIFKLRHGSLRSHVEARSPEEPLPDFHPPEILKTTLEGLPDDADPRIQSMLLGYFEDMNAVLSSALEIIEVDGFLALVVGNVRHAGVMIPVDEILVSIGQSLGYEAQTSWVARLRGNSAQQMGKYGRVPARESIVVLQKK